MGGTANRGSEVANPGTAVAAGAAATATVVTEVVAAAGTAVDGELISFVFVVVVDFFVGTVCVRACWFVSYVVGISYLCAGLCCFCWLVVVVVDVFMVVNVLVCFQFRYEFLVIVVIPLPSKTPRSIPEGVD